MHEACLGSGLCLAALNTQAIPRVRSTSSDEDPEGGPFPAYPSGKTWDEASGKTGVGKKFFHNIIEGSKVKTEPFYAPGPS